jgi:acyl-CoA thioesterase I
MNASCLILSLVAVSAFAESLTENEALFFSGDSRASAKAQLLRVPKVVPELVSSSRETKFEPGRDFVWQAGSREITLTADSRIPFKTTAELYPAPNSPNSYRKKRDGESWMFFGPGRIFHDAQCAATYASADDWTPPAIVPAPDAQLGKLRARLAAKQPVKVVMFGDSISTEADASARSKAAPNQPGYPTLVAQALEKQSGAKVSLANLSKGGMDAVWGTKQVAALIAEKPDVLLVAFGMNDASGKRTPEDFAKTIRDIYEPVRAANPECDIILISPMTANSEWVHAAPATYPLYSAALAKLTGDHVALADVTTTWTCHFPATG